MAEIVGVHGIKGTLKIKCFSENPEGLMDTPLLDQNGREILEIIRMGQHGTIYLADAKGLSDRTAAEKLRGTKLYAQRNALPEIKQENTYYHADLIGLDALHIDGSIMGKVIAVANFGAGDLLDIKPPKGNSFYVPFTNDAVPVVDIDNKKIVIDPPPGLLD